MYLLSWKALWQDVYQRLKVGLKLAGENSEVGDRRTVTFIMGDRLTLKENTKHKNCFKIQYKFREAITIVKRMSN